MMLKPFLHGYRVCVCVCNFCETKRMAGTPICDCWRESCIYDEKIKERNTISINEQTRIFFSVCLARIGVRIEPKLQPIHTHQWDTYNFSDLQLFARSGFFCRIRWCYFDCCSSFCSRSTLHRAARLCVLFCRQCVMLVNQNGERKSERGEKEDETETSVATSRRGLSGEDIPNWEGALIYTIYWRSAKRQCWWRLCCSCCCCCCRPCCCLDGEMEWMVEWMDSSFAPSSRSSVYVCMYWKSGSTMSICSSNVFPTFLFFFSISFLYYLLFVGQKLP